MTFSTWFLRQCDQNPSFVDQIWLSDEAHFCLQGEPNLQNNRVWSQSQLRAVHQRVSHPEKCTAWCAISSEGIIGPFWFEDSAGRALTVNADRYSSVLKKFHAALRNRLQEETDGIWFQQDSSGREPDVVARAFWYPFDLHHFFDRGSHSVACQLPDLTPLDYFLWDHIKSRVYQSAPRTIQDVKSEVRRQIRQVKSSTCRSVLKNLKKRASLCLERNGGYFEHSCSSGRGAVV